MKLSHYTLKNISTEHIIVPDEKILDLPEKVLQFGTGMLLRGLPDYFIDKANRKGIFNGRIVVVKSTAKGDSSDFDKQDGLYTICERGIVNGEKIELDIVSSSISRVLTAQNEWEEILECAHNPQLTIIISNTTEMGIQLVNDDIRRYPPVSFPGKLLSFLFERYIAFDGAMDSGFVIIPTELLPDNGEKLESIVLDLAHLNRLDNDFIEWLEGANTFCNSLVDRIVTGMPSPEEREVYFENLGYQDELLIVSEVYSLWAIEGDDRVKEILSFHRADEGVKIEPGIDRYRALKLHLLNGTHTMGCGIAYLAGFETVKYAMDNSNISAFLEDLMETEIGPSILIHLEKTDITDFSQKVLDRFRNPHIRHFWKSICQNYSAKMKLRCVPLIINYYKKHKMVPNLFAFGFAAYIHYMKAVKVDQKSYYGENNGDFYLIEDEMVSQHYQLWKNGDAEYVVNKVLSDLNLWNHNLNLLPGFEKTVLNHLEVIMADGMRSALKNVTSPKLIRNES